MNFNFSNAILLLLFIRSVAVTPTLAQADTTGTLEGSIVDADTRQPVVGAVISMETLKDGQSQQRQRIGPTGTFRLALIPGKGHYIQTEYYIRTEAPGYLPIREKFIVTSAYTSHIRNKTIYLTRGNPVTAAARPAATSSPSTINSATPAVVSRAPVSTTPATKAASAGTALPPTSLTAATRPATPVTAKMVETQLKAVQFVQSKAELLPDAQPALDQLLTFLRDNPGISIELAGHTDNQGDFDENLSLSKRRVETVKAFLVQRGIAAGRISSRGYSSTRPIASNNSEASRRLNRRVEMTILTK